MSRQRKLRGTFIKYLVAFYLPIFIMLMVFFVKGVFPFGDHAAIASDLNNQYISFFAYFKNHFTNIHDLFYSFSMSMGGNFFGIFAYYLMSPLNIIVLFFPIAKLPIAITLMILVKIGLLSCSMLCFLNYHQRNSSKINSIKYENKVQNHNLLNICLASSFALMTYEVSYATNLMWTDTIILLPIVILGLEKINNHERPYVYIISLFFAILLNYYIGFMVCIFVAIYYVYCLLITKFKWNIELKQQLKASFFKLLLSSVIGVGLSAVALLPGLKAVQSLKSNPYHFQLTGRFQPLDMLNQLYSGVTNNQAYPYLYGGMLVIVLCFIYFASKKIKLPEKITTGAFLLFLAMTQVIQGTYQIWHGFNSPNGMPNRNTFLFTFFLIIVADEVILNGSIKFTLKTLSNLMLIYVLGTFLLGKLNPSIITVPLITINILLFLGIIISLYYLNRFKKLTAVTLLLLIVADLGFNTYRHAYFTGISIDSFAKYTSQVSHVLKQLPDTKKDFYRVGTTFERSNDDPLLFDYYGLSNYSSAESPDTINLLQKMGYFQNHNWWRWTNFNNGSTFAVDSLFGVRYVVHNGSESMKSMLYGSAAEPNIYNGTGSQLGGYNLNYSSPYSEKIYSKNGYDIYKNKYALGLVNLVDKGALSANTIKRDTSADPFKYLNQVFDQVLATETPIYNAESVATIETTKSGQHDYQVRVANSGQLYFYLPTSNNTQTEIDGLQVLSSELFVNGKKLSKINMQQQNGITYLGKFNAGQIVNLSIRTNNNVANDINTLKPIVYREDSKKVATALASVKKNKVTHLKVSTKQISFAIKKGQDKHKIVMLSLPYDQGWQAFENGRQIKIHKALDGLMAITPTTKENSQIILKYTPVGLKLGLGVTGISLIGLGVYTCFIEVGFKRKKIK
ncbi:YfhO family protein [Loigolactobacillus zhaoyuanensis]|uniref:YfhO family protein n=1 Tax=Loigolactobacillus zhaoyuanensis TaxID=2486017 RepID=UPI000F744069|nr:YfhO family protein [Loigolactobacillus zhaoyuanensis]